VDPLGFVFTIAASILGGAIVGWFAHVYALDRSSDERRITDSTERIDRCSAMVAARVAYAAEWHRGGQWQPLKSERMTLERRHPTDVPAIVVGGTEEWEHYLAIETGLRHDKTTPPGDRARQIEKAGAAVLRLLATMREPCERDPGRQDGRRWGWFLVARAVASGGSTLTDRAGNPSRFVREPVILLPSETARLQLKHRWE
jgi:hypothetical protein